MKQTTILYSCRECGLKDASVEVDDIQEPYMFCHYTDVAIIADHAKRSSDCGGVCEWQPAGGWK